MSKRSFRDALAEGLGEGGVTEQVMGGPITGNTLVNKHKARMVDIDSIVPDPTQPRRPMPVWLRAAWNGRADGLPDTFQQWWGAAQTEIGQEIDIESYLFTEHAIDDTEGDSDAEDETVSYRKLMKLLNLAYDIYRRGLDTPIEVARGMIIYGERRWLAFQLLHLFRPGEARLRQIPALIADDFDVWKQANENGQHEKLNAIGNARMLAKLLMDIYGWDRFKPFNEFKLVGGSDRDYYAQIADGTKFPMPGDRVQDMVIALGLKSPSQLRQYRALLRLRHDVWVRADDEDRPERFLREIMKYQDAIADIDELFGKSGVTMVTPKSAPPPSPGRPTLMQTVELSSQKSRDAARQLALKGDPQMRDLLRKKAEEEVQWWQDYRKSLDL